MSNFEKIVTAEEARLSYLNSVVIAADVDRKKTIARHDQVEDEMLAERMASLSWKEKNEITERLNEHKKHDPRNYLPEYNSHESPYFGVVSIKDEKIGDRTYVIGKESLMDKNIAAVVDWRKAPVSRFFYEYEEGEDYDEEIQGASRIGVVTDKRKVLVNQKELHSVSKEGEEVRKIDGRWDFLDGDISPAPESSSDNTQPSRAADPSSHVLPEIVSLISADQFRIISSQTSGCVSLTGGAGCGKTSVAIHRLSFLQFNYPDLFQPERCLVMMFNRSLRDYVAIASSDLLGDTAVDTFSSWALRALKSYGLNISSKSIKHIPAREVGGITKGMQACEVVEEYVRRKESPGTTANDLFNLYRSESFLKLIKKGKREFEKSLEDRTLSWQDLPILLKICQANDKRAVKNGANNWYHHILIDEAQDLGYLELDCLFSAANNAKSLTVCSDSQQHILPQVDAAGLAIFQEKLYLKGLERENLKVSYRCPSDIMSLALSVRSGSITEDREYPNVSWQAAEDIEGAKDHLLKLVTTLSKSDVELTAVVCKRKTDVEILRKVLGKIKSLHPEGPMTFKPGVIVTNVHQVKGLEFDNVIIWNPSKGEWGANQTDVNLLYVAITRAAKTLHFVHYKPMPDGIKKPEIREDC